MISKFEHAANIGYALAIVFAVIGMIAKPTAALPVAILLLAIILWTACRMIRNGVMSFITLVDKGKDE